MKHEFLEIYSDLIESYGRVPTPPTDRTLDPRRTRLLGEAVEAGISQARVHVRPDAQLFLLVNFGEMVIKPLAHPGSPTRPSLESIALDIQYDTRTIVQAAIRESGSDAVTAADTMRVLPRVYGALKIKSADLWG